MAWNDVFANFDLGTGANDGSSEANAWRTIADVEAGVAPGDRVNIKRQAAAHNLTDEQELSVDGTEDTPIWYRAYASTPGDGGFWDVAYNAGGIAGLKFTGDYNLVEGVNFGPGASVNLDYFRVNGDESWAIRCKWDPRDNVQISNAYRCYGIVRDGRLQLGGAVRHGRFIECTFKRVGSTSETKMIDMDTFGVVNEVLDCVFIGAGNSGENGIHLGRMDEAREVLIRGCRFYDFNHGINVDDEPDGSPDPGGARLMIVKNLFDTMAGHAVHRTNTALGFVRIGGNYYRACTSGFTNYPVESEFLPNTSLSADPFVDAGSDDFNLNDDSGGGQVLRDASFDMDPTA